MQPLRNIFYKLSRTEQRREGVAAYLWWCSALYESDLKQILVPCACLFYSRLRCPRKCLFYMYSRLCCPSRVFSTRKSDCGALDVFFLQ